MTAKNKKSFQVFLKRKRVTFRFRLVADAPHLFGDMIRELADSVKPEDLMAVLALDNKTKQGAIYAFNKSEASERFHEEMAIALSLVHDDFEPGGFNHISK